MNKAALPIISHEQIAHCAYLIWEQEGRPHGRDLIHWAQAEQQLRAAQAHEAECVTQPAPKRPKQSRKIAVKPVELVVA